MAAATVGVEVGACALLERGRRVHGVHERGSRIGIVGGLGEVAQASQAIDLVFHAVPIVELPLELSGHDAEGVECIVFPVALVALVGVGHAVVVLLLDAIRVYPRDGQPGGVAIGGASGTTVGAGLFVASWPDDTYCDRGIRIPIDFSNDALSAVGAGIDAANGVGAATVTWSDASTAELAVVLAHDGGAGCYVPEGSIDDGSHGGMPLTVSPDDDPPPFVEAIAHLELTSDDGKLSHGFGVRARFLSSAEGVVDRVRLSQEVPCDSTGGTAAFALACGDFDVDTSGYDRAFVYLDVLYEALDDAPTLEGELRVIGEEVPECPAPEPGSGATPGCEGNRVTELAAVPFSAP